jgi:uncharacterized protein (DUF427 family)
MKQAEWNGAVLAETDDIVTVEGNAYFPAEALRREHFVGSDTRTTCPWKGEASYYTLRVNGQENKDAAWYYPEPKPAAAQIRGRVAFWKGVTVRDVKAGWAFTRRAAAFAGTGLKVTRSLVSPATRR